MNRKELIPVALIALIGSLCLACVAETEDALGEELVIPVCRLISESDTHQLNFSVGSNVTAASFLMDWANATSELGMVLVTPSGASIGPDTGEPITYQRNDTSIYYIIPDPEPGEWIAEITARAVPGTGEGYCAFMVLDKDVVLDEEEVDTLNNSLNLSDEELLSEEARTVTPSD